jgi:hypothetical protein
MAGDQPRIGPKALKSFLTTRLHYTPRRDEVEESIWEVDEDHDGQVSWKEFQTACSRCIFDTQGREPQQMFHYIIYAIFSQESDILMETQLKNIMFLRYGKDHAAVNLEKGFGQGPYNVSLAQFIRGMSKI